MSASIVAAQPAVADVDQQLVALGEERRTYEAWVQARADEHVVAVQAHGEAVEAALAAGEAPPAEPRPGWPIERHHDRVAGFVGRERMLADERTRAVAGSAPAVRAEARQEVADVLAEAAGHVEALDRLARRAQAARAAVADTEAAVDAVAGQRRNLDWGSAPRAAEMLEAVKGGRDLLQPGQARGGLGLTKFGVPDARPLPEPGRPGGAGSALAGPGRGVQR